MENAKILLIDDEPNITHVVKLVLETIGHFQVREENRAAAAVDAALDFQPDLVLLDINMPGVDGGEIAHAMEAQPALRGMIILFCSALLSKAEAGRRSVVRGGYRFLAKPVNFSVLLQTVRQLLAERCSSINRFRS